MPAVTLVRPLKVLAAAPERVSVPAPCLVNVPAPDRTPEKVFPSFTMRLPFDTIVPPVPERLPSVREPPALMVYWPSERVSEL